MAQNSSTRHLIYGDSHVITVETNSVRALPGSL